MKKPIVNVFTVIAILIFMLSPACERSQTGVANKTFVLYSGRSKSMVAPLVKRFEKKTGISVQVKYGKSAQLAMVLQEEGANSPADVFWAQDAGALGALSGRAMFVPLPEDISGMVPEIFRVAGGAWVPISGRARVLAYSRERVKEEELPQSVFELTDSKWKNRVGWAPSNGSFQAFVTAMRVAHGEEKTERWLLDMMSNNANAYPKNTPILQAISAGEIDLGLPNHYYLLRFLKDDANFPVKQVFFKSGDIGNLVNVAGMGLLKTAKSAEHALSFIRFLLEEETQEFFTKNLFEYPMIDSVEPTDKLVTQNELLQRAPKLGLDQLQDLEGTLKLLRKTGLL